MITGSLVDNILVRGFTYREPMSFPKKPLSHGGSIPESVLILGDAETKLFMQCVYGIHACVLAECDIMQ